MIITKVRLLLVGCVLFATLLALSVATLISSHNRANAAEVTTATYAFSGLYTAGANRGSPLGGGLTLKVNPDGSFTGTFSRLFGRIVPVTGTVNNGSIQITFDVQSNVKVNGQGTETSKGLYVGKFQLIYNGQEIASGEWSALAVDPAKSLTYTFSGTSNTLQTGAVVLDRETLTGTINLSNGELAPASAKFDGSSVTLVLNLSTGELVATGKSNNAGGYTGNFTGPGIRPFSYWNIQPLKFES